MIEDRRALPKQKDITSCKEYNKFKHDLQSNNWQIFSLAAELLSNNTLETKEKTNQVSADDVIDTVVVTIEPAE